MRPLRPGGTPMIIELAGLPGAGKTSLTRAVTLPHLGRTDIGAAHVPLRRETWRVASAAFLLSLTIRPWKPYLLVRVIKLVLALRFYGASNTPLVILDQGLVQKLWSMLIETQRHSERRLAQLIDALTPFLADHLVWIGVPSTVAARRIAQRKNGNSRFDGLPAETIAERLEKLERVYAHVIGLFRARARLPALTLDGEASMDENARRVEALATLQVPDTKLAD